MRFFVFIKIPRKAGSQERIRSHSSFPAFFDMNVITWFELLQKPVDEMLRKAGIEEG
jgi:hypothetical protein